MVVYLYMLVATILLLCSKRTSNFISFRSLRAYGWYSLYVFFFIAVLHYTNYTDGVQQNWSYRIILDD